MAQTCKPSTEASSDCAGCFTRASLLADFHNVPWSREITTPPVVAAYQASVPKAMSLTWKARSSGALTLDAACLAGAAVFFRLVPGAAADGAASATNKPAFTHLPLGSSYFVQPPLFSDAHQPVGAA